MHGDVEDATFAWGFYGELGAFRQKKYFGIIQNGLFLDGLFWPTKSISQKKRFLRFLEKNEKKWNFVFDFLLR